VSGKRLLGLGFGLCLLGLATSTPAKNKPLAGIVLYQDAAGPAYAQISDLLLNGKREVYVCANQESLDNASYRKLPKTLLTAGMILERDAAGLMTLTSNDGEWCALPTNLKLPKQALSRKELGDLARIEGRVLAKSTNAGETPPASFLPGMAIYLVADLDTELAEFLRARRTQAIPLWSDYIKQYPASPHIVEARKSLADLLSAQAEGELAAYRKSVADHAPDFGRLKNAKVRADEARRMVSSFTRAEKLQHEIGSELQVVLAGSRNELNAYLTALNEHKPGYDHLRSAQSQMQKVFTVDSMFPGANHLDTEIVAQTQALDAALTAGELLVAAKRYDQAFAAVSRFKDMAAELPRVAAIIGAAFSFHRGRGTDASSQGQWEMAISEFRRALEYQNDTETSAALKKAQGELEAVEDKAAAARAIEESNALAASKRYIEAYDALEQLSDHRRSLVTEQMDALRKNYVEDLMTRAATLRRVHTPIRGHADENGARQAHDYLERAASLVEAQPLRIQLDLLNSAISDYYLKEAKRLIEKPRGSGVGLGWLLLQEARRFKPEQETVRDQLTRYAPEYENRAKLSISVTFRDQTSLRDSLGFAGQLENAVATGLESAGLPGLKILAREDRQFGTADGPNTLAGVADANLLIHGNILQHHVEKKIESQSLSSHYRSGQREVKNPAWLEVKRENDAVQQEYDRALEGQRVAAPHLKKKELAESNRNLEALAAKLQETKAKLDAISETLLQDTILAYNYVKRTTQLNAVAEVSFRLDDPISEITKSEVVRVETPKTVVVLENIKPEDSDGIVQEGVPPDETQLLQEAENAVKELMLKKMIEQLNRVPARVLGQARDAASRSDLEEAAAKYILYLNSTPNKDAPERQEGQQFLRKHFNVMLLGAAR